MRAIRRQAAQRLEQVLLQALENESGQWLLVVLLRPRE